MRRPPASTAELEVLAWRPGRFADESRVVLSATGGARARGLWFAGRPAAGARPWADLDEADADALPAIARALGPGASIMVRYGGDDTERALRRRVPAAATPLGLALLRAGCRWLKDWYFAEGGREGHTKLQGELPLDADHGARTERMIRAELEAFLAGTGVTQEDRCRSHQALMLLTEGTASGRDARRQACAEPTTRHPLRA